MAFIGFRNIIDVQKLQTKDTTPFASLVKLIRYKLADVSENLEL